MIAGIGVVSALYWSLLEFGPVDDLADEVATNHDELACAMYQADGDVGALVALNDKIDELFSVAEALILKNLNNGPTLKALYAGRDDQTDIAAELEAAGYELGDFDCGDCDMIGEYRLYDNFDDGILSPHYKDAGVEWIPGGAPDYYYLRWRYDAGSNAFYNSVLGMRIWAELDYGTGDTITIHQLQFEYWMTAANAGWFVIDMFDDTGSRQYIADNVLVKTTKIITPSPAKVCTYNLNDVFRIRLVGGVGNYGIITSVQADFDTTG